MVIEIFEISSEFSQIISYLHLRSFSTNELILSYYSQLTDEMEKTMIGRVPSINLQLGYIKTTGDNVLILINVLDLTNIPLLNSICDRVDPFVKLELLPKVIYPETSFLNQKTKTLAQCLNPAWKQDFQFLVPQQLFFTNGSTLCISVLDHDNELIGRSFIATSKLLRLESLSFRRMPPPKAFPLLQPGHGHNISFYKMLKERSTYDQTARHFLTREKVANEMYIKCISRRFSTRFINRK